MASNIFNVSHIGGGSVSNFYVDWHTKGDFIELRGVGRLVVEVVHGFDKKK